MGESAESGWVNRDQRVLRTKPMLSEKKKKLKGKDKMGICIYNEYNGARFDSLNI